ncbi:MAG: PilW family protein, partial [Endozoicomonas sp.]
YFIKKDNDVRTLFKKNVSVEDAFPVVRGVEDIRIYYGLDKNEDGVADRFIRASDREGGHPDWKQVTVVRVHALVQSFVELTPSPRAYFFDGERVVPEDRFLRREYVMSIATRN